MGSIARAQDAAATPAAAAAPAAAAQAPAAAPAAAPAPVWSVGPMDLSGYVDVYYSYNVNRPADMINGAPYDLYNFDDATGFNLEAAKITVNHSPDPVGAHVDVIFGRTNALLRGITLTPAGGTPSSLNSGEVATDFFLEQAYASVAPAKGWHGTEIDFGQFVTSAGDEVIETMSNWSYSHGLLFTDAIPYYHFGLRTSTPFTKTWTAGVQVVNGWNNVLANNGGVTVGVTSSYVKPKYTWNANYYTGPGNAGTEKGYKNLADTTLLLTPTAKFNAYVNYDYGQNTTYPVKKAVSLHWQGLAASARGQITGNAAIVGRYEYFYDQGNQTGIKQTLQEFTGTYEYKWPVGLLVRAEYRYDWSNKKIFTYGNTPLDKTSQQTATIGIIAFFGPKR
jgi:hypothetical protein